MDVPRTKLIQAREKTGKSPEEVAAEAGISAANYYDLESYDDEPFLAISLGHLRNVCKVVGITLSQLFGAPRGDTLSLRALAGQVRQRLLLDDQFEELVGWKLDQFIENPESAWESPADFLRDVCDGVGVEWLSLLNSMDP